MVRFGIIGTSAIVDRFIEASEGVEAFSLAAVYSRTEEQARLFASKYNIPATFTDLESFAQSDLFDAVYIASPNALHAEQAITCMSHGKHVLCEKPIASNTAELTNMIQSAQANNVLLMEALKTTLLPNFQAIKDNLYKIGTVRRYMASFCQYSSRYDAYKEGIVLNAFNPALSNGALMDIGVYCIYPLVVLFGEPQTIKANAYMLESGVDGSGSLLLGYPEMEAVIVYSKITDSYIPSEIQGENGSIIFDKVSIPGNVQIRYKDGTTEDITGDQRRKPMYYEITEFIRLIQHGQLESEINSHHHSMVTAKIMEQARKQINLIYPADTNNQRRRDNDITGMV